MNGQLLYHRSRLDGKLQPLPVCATHDGSDPKALILDLSPGAISDLVGSIKRCEQLAGWARDEGAECVIAKPCGRGPGTVYQGPGEIDVFEAIETLCSVFPIDPDRISLTGGSMGGAATWYLASHYPDQFAAAAPFCGYCDYRLWRKPGGLIMRMQPWEEFSWQSRGAAFRVENLRNMGLWITHGEWDIGIGGGVPVEHSRRMSEALEALDIPHTYVEVPSCGHGCMTEEATRPVLAWLSQQRRNADPGRIALVLHGLRHSRSHWVAVDQMETYGQPARVEAHLENDDCVTVTTHNVRRLSLGPRSGVRSVEVQLDDQRLEDVDLSTRAITFERPGGQWERSSSTTPAMNEKRHAASGPIGDIFFEPLRLVKGTAGSAHEAFLIDWMSDAIPPLFKQKNGGVHRGIFDGESWYDIPVVEDSRLTGGNLEACNLILLGTFESNQVLARFRGEFPLEFGDGFIRLGDSTYRGRHVGLSACFPSPADPDRLVVVTGGITPQAITSATHLNLQLLPDYLLWDGDEVLDYGFFDSAWHLG